MPHHFPKATVEATCWCNTCYRNTRWRVFDGRRQFCLECFEKKQKEAKEQKPEPPAAEQGRLF